MKILKWAAIAIAALFVIGVINSVVSPTEVAAPTARATASPEPPVAPTPEPTVAPTAEPTPVPTATAWVATVCDSLEPVGALVNEVPVGIRAIEAQDQAALEASSVTFTDAAKAILDQFEPLTTTVDESFDYRLTVLDYIASGSAAYSQAITATTWSAVDLDLWSDVTTKGTQVTDELGAITIEGMCA